DCPAGSRGARSRALIARVEVTGNESRRQRRLFCFLGGFVYPPLEGAGRLTWSEAQCETGWGDGLATSDSARVDRLSPRPGSHFASLMRSDPPPQGAGEHRPPLQ